MTSQRPEFDAVMAATLPGKVVLIGVTYVDAAGGPLAQRQWVGRILRASEDGIAVELEDSEEPCILPPDPRSFRPAAPGTYRLRHSGREVTDPDFVCTWIHRQGAEPAELRPPVFSSEWVGRDDDDPPQPRSRSERG